MPAKDEPDLILLIEDNPGIAELVREKLDLDGKTIVHVKTGKTACTWLEQNRPRLILLDYSLPDMSGLELVEKLAAMPGGMPPFIVTTGAGDERIAVTMMKQGAREYLIKDSNFLESISVVVEKVLRELATEQHLAEAERALQESRERYDLIFEQAGDYAFLLKPQGDNSLMIANVNQAALKAHGYSREELVGKPITLLDPEITPERLAELCQIIDKEGAHIFNSRHRCKDGTILDLEINSRLVTMDNEKYYLSIERDITSRLRAEDETRRRARELETLTRVSAALRAAGTRSDMYPVLLQQVSDLLKAEGAAIALRDPVSGETVIELGFGEWKNWTGVRLQPGEGISGRVISAGQSYRTDDAENDPFARHPELFHGLNAAACVPLGIGKQVIGALWIGRKDAVTGEDMRLLTAIGDMAANAIQRQTLHDDLQEQFAMLRDTQARLVQSEKLAAIGQLVSGVAHELNTPLTSVILYSQLVQQEPMSEAAKQNLSKVISEAQRAGRIVRGLLDFARQRPMDRRLIRVDEVIQATIELVTYDLNANDIRLELKLAPSAPVIMADPHQLTQVFVNLLQNAWQAMSAAHGHGVMKIVTEVGESIYLAHAHEKPHVLRIRFEDDGPGIPEAIIGRIFDPFFTTKPDGKGTGLGLSICHGIITEHGGHIWAESVEGQGSTFIIELPVSG